MNRTMLASVAILVGAIVGPPPAMAQPVVTTGCDLTPSLTGAVRYRNLSNQAGGAAEIYVGDPTFASRASGDLTWNSGRSITITYDGVGTLTTTLTSPVVTVTRNVGNLGALNYLQIDITKNTAASSVSLDNLTLGSTLLGSFRRASGSQGSTCWRVTNIDVGGGFSLTGTLALTGGFGGGDSSYAQVTVGSIAVSDDEGPVTSNVTVTPDPVLLNGDVTVRAIVDDTGRGDSTIASADYSLNGGTWLAMAVRDLAFDEVEEDVEVTFTGTQLGTNTVCVRGADILGNVGEPTCQNFLVTYKFTGFFSPLETDFLNTAKAGQSIPVKWRLTDAHDVPIENMASFAGLFSSQQLCDGGLPTDAVDEPAAGNSGLQYVGDGYWQYNWKSDKAYATTCRAMYVEFDSGATSPIVKFQFKK